MSFQDPIESNGALILESLHSPNYVAGVSGWTINKDGSSEFSNIIARGSWIVSHFTGVGTAYIQCNINLTLGGPVLQFHTDTGNDFYIFSVGAAPSILVITPNSLSAPSNFSVFSNGNFSFNSIISGTAIVYDQTSGFLYYSPNANLGTIPGWQDAVLQNGWVNIGLGFANAGFRVMPDGTVQLRGTVGSGTSTDNTVLFTLPANMRPGHALEIPVKAAPIAGMAWLQVHTDGNVLVENMSGATNISLDGCRFAII